MAQDRTPWPIKPGSQIWPLISRFAPVRDLLLRANYLFVPAMMASAPGGRAADCVSMKANHPTKVE